MASPFPGMDPYLEDPAFWPDFHHHFLECWYDAIADQLPDDYEARLDETVRLVQMALYPDIGLIKGRRPTGTVSNGSKTALLEPVTIPHEFLEEVRDTRIDILHRPERSLVGVLELLSPTNKNGEGFQEYRAKRKAVLIQKKVHLLELDLLLGGSRLPLLRPLPKADYYVLLSRAENRPNCEVFAWTMRDPLPTVPIRLKAPDPDIFVDLSKVFQTTYERGRYARSLSYGKAPRPPMSARDAKWATALARKK